MCVGDIGHTDLDDTGPWRSLRVHYEQTVRGTGPYLIIVILILCALSARKVRSMISLLRSTFPMRLMMEWPVVHLTRAMPFSSNQGQVKHGLLL